MKWGEIQLHEPLAECIDSLLYDNSTSILTVRSENGRYRAEIEVCGDISILYKGELYTRTSEYTDEVIDAIRKGSIYDTTDFDIRSNNWFELCLYEDGDYIGGDVWESDLSTASLTEIRECIIDYFEDYFSYIEED